MMLPKREKKYSVHSAFLTIQGEGCHAGRRAVFCRLAGCNVWNGNPDDRQRDSLKSECALICDTEFRKPDPTKGGGVFTARELSKAIAELWDSEEQMFVVFTGGEPGLQITFELVDYLHLTYGAYVACETNGSIVLPENLDWVTCSPKPPMPLLQTKISELKLLSIYDPRLYDTAAKWSNNPNIVKWLQPVDFGDFTRDEMQKCLLHVFRDPTWRMGLQQHKIWGVE